MTSLRQRHSRLQQWQQDSSRHIAQPSDEQHRCRCCGAGFTGNFCPQCGQKATIGRITWTTVRQGISMLWGMDSRSLPYTLWQLLLRPGYLIGDYIRGKRQVSFPPIKMLALVAVFVFLVNNALSTDPEEPEADMLGNDYLLFNYAIRFFDKHLDMAFLFFLSLLIIPTRFIFRFAPRYPRHNLPEGFFIQVFNSTISLLWILVLIVLTPDDDNATPILLMIIVIVYRSYHQLFGYGHWATLWRTAAVFLAAGMMLILLIATDNIISQLLRHDYALTLHKFTHRFLPSLAGMILTIAASYLISRRTASHPSPQPDNHPA